MKNETTTLDQKNITKNQTFVTNMNYYTKVDIQVESPPNTTVIIVGSGSGLLVLLVAIIVFIFCSRKKPIKKEQVADWQIPISESKLKLDDSGIFLDSPTVQSFDKRKAELEASG